MTSLTLFWLFPHVFLAQPQAFAAMGVFFSPLLRADWLVFAEEMPQCDGGGTRGLGLPGPAQHGMLHSLLSPPDTPCSLGNLSMPCCVIRKLLLGLKASDSGAVMESDGEVVLWPRSPYLGALGRSLHSPGSAPCCAWRRGRAAGCLRHPGGCSLSPGAAAGRLGLPVRDPSRRAAQPLHRSSSLRSTGSSLRQLGRVAREAPCLYFYPVWPRRW